MRKFIILYIALTPFYAGCLFSTCYENIPGLWPTECDVDPPISATIPLTIRVVDKQTGAPIQGATIKLEESHGFGYLSEDHQCACEYDETYVGVQYGTTNGDGVYTYNFTYQHIYPLDGEGFIVLVKKENYTTVETGISVIQYVPAVNVTYGLISLNNQP